SYLIYSLLTYLEASQAKKKKIYKGVLIFLTDFTRPPLSADNCKRSAIIFNATLVNGYQSGKFVDHGDLGTIAACQDMCCQSPMCDVAFLVGKRCYSVYCHSESQCLWTPSKHNKYMLQLSYIHSAHRISNSVEESMVTSRETTLPVDVATPSCHYGHVYYNYSLLYGRKAGNFTEQGEVENMSECLRMCCKETSCKIALMLEQNCYSVSCRGKFCQTVPVNPLQFKPRIAHVIRPKVILNTNSGFPFSSPNHSHHPPGGVSYNVTLRQHQAPLGVGGGKAEHHSLPKAPGKEKPRRHRTKIPASRISEIPVVTPVIKMISLCSHGPSYYGVTLLGGFRAGHFVGHGQVDSMQACIKKCCANQDCDLAFMVREDCYSVICYHKSLCRSVRAKHVKKYQPRIAHIWRGSNHEKEGVSGQGKSPAQSQSYMIERKHIAAGSKEQKGAVISKNHMKSRKASKVATLRHKGNGIVSGKIGSPSQPRIHKGTHTPKTKKVGVMQYNHSEIKKRISSTKVHSHFSSSASFKKQFPGKNDGNKQGSVLIKANTQATDTEDHLHSVSYKEPNLAARKPKVNDNTCRHSAIQHNVGLRRGLKTGTFAYIGEFSDITKCLKVCCRDPKCDIAFMLDQSCYTVNCANESVCHSVSYHQHQYSTSAVFIRGRFHNKISSVSGLQRKENSFHESAGGSADFDVDGNLQNCSTYSYYNMTLRAGLKAGNFTFFGKVTSTKDCVARCCLTKGCDVTFVVLNRCFLVDCFSDDSCDIINARNTNRFKPVVTFVNLTLISTLLEKSFENSSLVSDISIQGDNETNEASNTQVEPTHEIGISVSRTIESERNTRVTQSQDSVSSPIRLHPSECIYSFPLRNVSFRIGRKAGIFINHGVAKNVSECAEYCCLSLTCDVAFMISNDCFFVRCHSDKSCETKTIRNSTFYPRMIFVKKHGVTLKGRAHKAANDLLNDNSATPAIATNRPVSQTLNGTLPHKPKERRHCSHAKIITGVTLTGGYYAGIFTKQEYVESMPECISRCCSLPTCNVAFMVSNICYAVQCFSEEKCTTAKAHYSRKYHPQVSHVRKLFLNIIQGDFKGKVNRHDAITKKLRCVLEDVNEPKHRVKEGAVLVHTTAHDLGDCAKLCCQTEGCKVALQDNGTCYSLNCHTNMTCPKANLSRNIEATSQSLVVIKDKKQSEMHPERDLTETCHFSSVLHEVVLRGGSQSGKFKYLTEVDDMATCIKECCKYSVCDLALMLKDNCFLVSCHSEVLCEPIRSRSSDYHPQIAYKIKRGKNRHIGKAGSKAGLVNFHQSTSLAGSKAGLESFHQSASHHLVNGKKHRVDRSKEFTYVTFRNGLEAGIFTESGKVKDMESCVERCYNRSSCHVAFMVEHSCYSIHCYSQKTCEVLPVQTPIITTRVVYLKDRMLKLPYITTKEHKASPFIRDDKNFTITNCAKNVTVLKNMTFLAGMSAGNYTDYGTVDSIQACSNICCSKKVCDAAFMILNNCFTIDCISDKACHAIPSKSRKVNTSIVYFRKTLSTGRPQQMQKKPKVGNQQLCPLLGGIRKGVTFSGGLTAGDFTDHGYFDNFSSCIKVCCRTEACDIAFMVENNCYSVKCAKNRRRCIPVVARPTKFKTFMAIMKASVYSEVHTQASYDLKCAKKGPIQHNLTFKKGIKAGNFTEQAKVKDMSHCIQACCNISSCSAAFMIEGKCYSVACHSKKDCETRAVKSKVLTTVIAFINHTRKGRKSGEPGLNLKQTFTKSILGGHCDITNVQRNVNITGGWKAGKFLRIPDIKNMVRCTEACCDYHGCAAAMFIGQYCYNLVCFKTKGCQLIGSHGGFMIDRFVAVRKNTGNLLSPIMKAKISELTASKEHVSHSFFMEPVQNAGNNDVQSTLKNASSNTRIDNKARTPFTKLNPEGKTNYSSSIETKNSETLPEETYSFKSDYSLMMEEHNRNRKRTYACTHTFVFNNATLRGGLNAGDVKNEGKVEGMEECVDICCKTLECNVALMLNEKCYIVACSNKRSCEAIPDRHSTGETKVAYVARSKDETELIKKLISQTKTSKPVSVGENKTNDGRTRKTKDLQSATNNNIVRQGSCFRSPILKNVRFKLGRHAGDFKPVGLVKNIEQCVTSCCKENACNAIFMLGSRCHLVSCSNEQDCQTVEAKSDFYQPRVVYLARSEAEVTYLFKLVPKDILENYKGNETDHANATGDGDESAVRRSQLERAESNNSISSTYFEENAALCKHSIPRENSTLRGGAQSGLFKEVGKVNSDTECISQCCISNSCDAAFLLLNRCFLVTCKSKSLCESVPAKNIVFRPRVIYMENKMALNRRGRVQEGSKSLFSGSQSGSIALKKRHHSSFNPPQLKNEREDPCKASIIRQNRWNQKWVF
ncbi:hypothetical protein pdam_00022242, partial [Pocillopora damicornis]